jgi:beta-N-acetylhexosaminidase
VADPHSKSGAAFVAVGIPGPTVDAESAAILRSHPPGAVVLFARNVESAEQLRALTTEVRQLAPGVLLAVDAEGGRVDRLAKVVGAAPAASRLAQLPPSASEAAGEWVGRALRLFDFDLDFAPVVDLDRGLQRNALDGRYLGSGPESVAMRARGFLAGLHRWGIGGCLKHFPGLGGALADTHFGIARIALSAVKLVADWQPFAELAGLARAVMVSHAFYDAYESAELPATLSPAIATGLLRERLGFDGWCVADDLEMGALARWGDLGERAVAAFAAGCDLLPVCSQIGALPEIAARLAAPMLRDRRHVAGERMAAYRGHLERLRAQVAPESVAFGRELAAVREGLAASHGFS